MKSHLLISILIISLFGVGFSNQTTVVVSSGNLGDIKYSILPPVQFKKLNGNGWKWLDGSNISGTDLHNFLGAEGMQAILKNNKLPNANGMFIRAMGNAGRKVGTTQEESTRKPANFKISSTGSQNIQLTYRDDFFNTDGPHGTGSSKISKKEAATIGIKTTTGKPVKGQAEFDMDNHYFYYRNRKTSIQKVPNHSHTISGWDKETRPKNIAFYVYIKVGE